MPIHVLVSFVLQIEASSDDIHALTMPFMSQFIATTETTLTTVQLKQHSLQFTSESEVSKCVGFNVALDT